MYTERFVLQAKGGNRRASGLPQPENHRAIGLWPDRLIIPIRQRRGRRDWRPIGPREAEILLQQKRSRGPRPRKDQVGVGLRGGESQRGPRAENRANRHARDQRRSAGRSSGCGPITARRVVGYPIRPRIDRRENRPAVGHHHQLAPIRRARNGIPRSCGHARRRPVGSAIGRRVDDRPSPGRRQFHSISRRGNTGPIGQRSAGLPPIGARIRRGANRPVRHRGHQPGPIRRRGDGIPIIPGGM